LIPQLRAGEPIEFIFISAKPERENTNRNESANRGGESTNNKGRNNATQHFFSPNTDAKRTSRRDGIRSKKRKSEGKWLREL
jgi:hypothetical protein